MNYAFSIEVSDMVKHRLGQYSDLIQQETEMPEAYEWFNPADYSVLVEGIDDHNFPDSTGVGYIDRRFRNRERRLIRGIIPIIKATIPFTLEFSEVKFHASLSFVAFTNIEPRYQILLQGIRSVLREMGLLYIIDYASPAGIWLSSYKIGRAEAPPKMVALVPEMSVPCEVKSIVLKRSRTAEERKLLGQGWQLLKRWRLS